MKSKEIIFFPDAINLYLLLTLFQYFEYIPKHKVHRLEGRIFFGSL